MDNENISLIGITMGCPVGIGPEILIKFFSTPRADDRFQPIVLGDCSVLRRTADEIGSDIKIISWQPGMDPGKNTLPVLDLSTFNGDTLQWGKPDAITGKAMAVYIEEAVRLIEAGVLSAMVTCPITKSALQLAGYKYPGHTEMLATLSGTDSYAMMMAGKTLRVTLVTIHEPLSLVPKKVDKQAVIRMIDITGRALRDDFGIDNPRIAVAGLNPHSGENGLFGNEEEEVISPAIEKCKQEWQISGPYPPDTVFFQAAKGIYDCVVAMYHDQGLIPFKLLHFFDGVNVTLGLPLVRTSVDHGTGYDIAGTGVADPSSLSAAYHLAGEIVMNRRNNES